MKQLAENLKRIRKERGRTQAWVAERIHIDRSTYTKYETGAAEPPLETCIYLCIVLDTTPNELLGWNMPTDDVQPMSQEEIEEFARKKGSEDFIDDPSRGFVESIKNFLTKTAFA